MSENSNIVRMTVTVTPEVASAMRAALGDGAYASNSEIVHEALRDWQHKRRLRETELAALRGELALANEDIAEGRVGAFDAEKIIREGRGKSTDRSPST